MKSDDPSHFRIPIKLQGRFKSTNNAAMIDSGATGLFLHQDFVKRHRIFTRALIHPITLYNIDGSVNTAGRITHSAKLLTTVDKNQPQMLEYLITNLGSEDIILGLPWLRRVNPNIDWQAGRLVVPPKSVKKVTIEEVPEPKETNIGGTTEQLLEANLPEYIPLPPVTLDEYGPTLDTEETLPYSEEGTPLYKLNGNRKRRRALLRAGILQHTTDELWCAAGYTYSQQLAEAAHKEKPQKTFEEMVPVAYQKHAKVFSEQQSERLPEHKPWDHAIDLKPDAPETMRTKIYPMSPNEQEELNRFLEENLRKGYIRPSKSPLASPVFFVKKKDGKLRFVQDYRRINEYTIKNRYPLPLVADIVNQLRKAKIFTKFDVRWGYNNIRIKEGHEWKAAFATNRGLYEPLVMYFGLTNSPATFQALMNSIFADLITAEKVAVYLDDILIFTESLEEHRQLVGEVLQRLADHDLYLRPEKCEFECSSIEYLGLVISEGEVRMDPVKVEAVKNWQPPSCLRDL
jgi:hypothetical protein